MGGSSPAPEPTGGSMGSMGSSLGITPMTNSAGTAAVPQVSTMLPQIGQSVGQDSMPGIAPTQPWSTPPMSGTPRPTPGFMPGPGAQDSFPSTFGNMMQEIAAMLMRGGQ